MKKKYLMEYNMIFANILSTILMFVCIGIGFLVFYFNLITVESFKFNFFIFFIFIVIMFGYLGIHELVHGITYRLTGAKSENIKYGIALEKGILFCKCGGDVSRKCILTSVIMPFIVLGLFTGIISIIFNLPLLFILSLLNISGCSGDLMMFCWFLNRDKDIKFREIGDSTTFIITTTEELNKKKFVCCKVKEVINKVEDNKFLKKINCSKESFIVLIIISIIIVIDVILYFFV